MDSRVDEKSAFVTTVGDGKDNSLQKIFVLHQNVRSLSGKITELGVLLQSSRCAMSYRALAK
jgi:hypothetical protein